MYDFNGFSIFVTCDQCGAKGPDYPATPLAHNEWVRGILHDRAIRAGWFDTTLDVNRKLLCPECRPDASTCAHDYDFMGTSYGRSGVEVSHTFQCTKCDYIEVKQISLS